MTVETFVNNAPQEESEDCVRCERCGKPGADVQGEAVLCESCLSLVIREWRIKFEEIGELSA